MSASPIAGGGTPALQNRVYSGLKWVGITMVLLRCTRFVTTAVLTWLLLPAVFDEMTLALAVVGSLGVVREFGLGQAYVQMKVRDDAHLAAAKDTAFTLTMAFNLGLFVLAWTAIPWIAEYYPKHPGLAPILRVVFLTFVLDAFANTPGYILHKDLRFRHFSATEMWAGVTNAVIAIGMALGGLEVWSLVGGFLGSRAIQAVQLFHYSGYRPRLRIDRSIASELFHFGKYMWGFAALSAVGGMFDRLVMGHAANIGKGELGMYGIASNLCLLPATQITFLVGRIAFPALSQIRDDTAELRRAFLKALNHVSVLAIPVGFGLWAVAPDLVAVCYGKNFQGIAPIVAVLAFYGMLMAVASVSGPTFQAIGKPQVLFHASLVHHAILFPLVLWLLRYGVLGVAVGIFVPLVVSSAIGFVLVARCLTLRASTLLVPIAKTLVAGGAMALCVKLLQSALGPNTKESVRLALSVAVGVAVYFAIIRLTHRDLLKEFRQTMRRTAVASEGA
ncbi:MAG: lipopolysaccharide biosynthesis protein [Planctomycetes bacterium]|nr:lipopolysaccharide biosynthesis protein [Planctomycetota bacterium]